MRPAPHPLVQSGAVRRFALPTVVSLPTDPGEREAVEVSQRVMRMPGHAPSPPAVSARSGGILSAPMPAVHPAKGHVAGTAEPDIGQEIHDSLGSGMPLPQAVQAFMTPRFHTDFSGVRIHATPQAAHLATRLQARAFTYRNHIFFGQNEFRPETSAGQALIAHELTHTIQQSDVIQRDASPGIVDSVTGSLKSAWSDITDFTDAVGWKLVRTFAPSLEPLINKGPDGIFDWLKERAGAAVDGMFNVITAPVRAVGGAGQQLSAQFQPLVATVQGAVGKIARNDCLPLREAAEEIEHVATELVTPVIEKVQPIVAAVKQVAGELWDKVGAPVLDVIKEYAAEKWQEIQTVWGAIKAVAAALWDQTADVRELFGKAWIWLKNKLGIGEGAEGQAGLLQWAERKLDSAWTWLKTLLAPFSRQLTIIGTAVGGVLIALSPAGPVLAIGAGIAGAAKGLQWISANWGQGNLLVQSRVYLEKTLIPPLVAAANNLSGTITRMATSITGALHGLATGVADAARALGGEVLAALAAPIQWVADQITALADWATGQLSQVSQGLTSALRGLQTFLQNMLEFFTKVGGVVLDIYGLPVLLAGKIWGWIPACIRDPIVDFLGPIILQQIELFSELGKDKEAWLKTKAEIGNLIKLVFKDHDLIGAVKAAFNLVLRVFNLPPDLLATVAAKAMAAWDTISKKPLDFLKNTVRSLGRGFALLWRNFGSHLKFGLQGWLFSGLQEKNINPPASWTNPKALFFFVLEVLGLSVDHVFDLLKQRFPPERVEALRKWYGRIGRVVDWINKTIDVNKSAAENTKGLIDQAKDFGTSILTGIATWVTTKVGEELAILAASAAASAGLSEVLDVARRIYKALVTAKRWARQLLDMANSTLDNIMDIAGGAVEKVGTKFEGILHLGMPMVIGFLADQVGLGGIGEEMRTIVDKLRAGVDKGILWLIDKVKAALGAVAGATTSTTAGEEGGSVAETHFAIGTEQHVIKASLTAGKISLTMASELVEGFSDHLHRIEAVWVPLRQNHPAGNLAAELNQLAADGAKLMFAANTQMDRRAQGQERNKSIDNLAARLRDICRKFDIPKLGGLGNYKQPPPHNPVYGATDGFGRASSMYVVLSFNTRPFMRSTQPSVDVPGTRIVSGYQRGHLLAASLGGSNSNSANFAPMSASTNTSRGGIENFEQSLRNAIRDEVFPPWIVGYGIECKYVGGISELQSGINSILGPQPAAASALFALASSKAPITGNDLVSAFKISPGSAVATSVLSNEARLRDLLLMNFTPRRFAVTVNIEQMPERGKRLPAAQPFDNHM